MNGNFSEEIKKELLKQAVKGLENPFKMLTVKDVAKDLYMGENKTNEIFNRKDFQSVNIGKTKKIQKIAYILWKMEKRNDVLVLYQMLCLQTANNDGTLASKVGEMFIPFNSEKIARDTKYFSVDTVVVALELFKKLQLVSNVSDNCLRLVGFENMVGSETRLREAGVDMKIIQYLVGHVEGSSITDDVYTSVSKEFIENELKKLKKKAIAL